MRMESAPQNAHNAYQAKAAVDGYGTHQNGYKMIKHGPAKDGKEHNAPRKQGFNIYFPLLSNGHASRLRVNDILAAQICNVSCFKNPCTP